MILVINKSRKRGNAAVEIFRYMGILARAETPDSAFSEVSMIYRAVLIMNPQGLPDEKDYLKQLRSYTGKTPIFAMSDGDLKNEDLYDMTFSESITSSRLLQYILEYSDQRNLPILGEYMLSGINASIDLGGVAYYNDAVPFTKTETMILRLLIRAYPSPLTPKVILKYAFTQSKLPEESGIRTHISSINKKFKEIVGHTLITSFDSSGYIISTPQLNRRFSVSAI